MKKSKTSRKIDNDTEAQNRFLTKLLPRYRVDWVHHTGEEKNDIQRFLHCRRCLAERPPDVSPQEWSALEVGITSIGRIQVWCKRHDINVDLIQCQPAVRVPDETLTLPECLECGGEDHAH